jgi:hypothetical protein
MKECYLIYSCDLSKSTRSMKLEYIVEDKNDLFRALRSMVKNEGIEVDNFNNGVETACEYLYIYQNNMNKLLNGELNISDLDSHIRYASIQKSYIGFEF